MLDDGLFRVVGSGFLLVAAVFLWLIFYRHRHSLLPQRSIYLRRRTRRPAGWPDPRWETARDAVTVLVAAFTGYLLLTVADSLTGFQPVPGADDEPVLVGELAFTRGELEPASPEEGVHTAPHRITFTRRYRDGTAGRPVRVFSHGDAVVLGYTRVTPQRTVLSTLLGLFGVRHTDQVRLDFVGGRWQVPLEYRVRPDTIASGPATDDPRVATFGSGRPPEMVSGREDDTGFPFPWSLWVARWQFEETDPSSHRLADGAVPGDAEQLQWAVWLASDGIFLEPIADQRSD